MRVSMVIVFVVLLVAGIARGQAPATLELRAEANITGAEVRLKQLARWPQRDNAFFASLLDLTVARFEPGQQELSVELSAVRATLEAAGVSGAEVSFRGPSAVRVRRLDYAAGYAQRPQKAVPKDLNEFLDKNGVPAPSKAVAATRPTADVSADASASSSTSSDLPPLPRPVGETLREALVRDLAERLTLKREDIELTFDPADERVIGVASPVFSWSITPKRVRDLGQVTWGVTIYAGDATAERQARRVEITARARAWQEQVVARRAMTPKQMVREDDLELRRVLVERMPETALATRDQLLTMQSGMQIPPGTVLNVRMFEPLLLVRSGQVVTVISRQGAFEVRSVARAIEGGSYGQSVRVRNDDTNETLQGIITGPQEVVLGGPAVASSDR